jgi:hypothetical protein
VTSGTIFAFHKMPLRQYLAAIAIFMNEVKGKSALALSRDLDCQSPLTSRDRGRTSILTRLWWGSRGQSPLAGSGQGPDPIWCKR